MTSNIAIFARTPRFDVLCFIFFLIVLALALPRRPLRQHLLIQEIGNKRSKEIVLTSNYGHRLPSNFWTESTVPSSEIHRRERYTTETRLVLPVGMNQVHVDSVSEKAVRRRYKGPKTISYDSTLPRVKMASASTSGSQQPTATQKLANKALERRLTNQLYEDEFKDEYNHVWWSATYIAVFLDSTKTQRQVTIGWCIRPHCSKQHAHEEAANCALKILDADPTIDGRVPSTQ